MPPTLHTAMSRVPLATGSALSGWINDRINMNISRNALSCCVLRIVELTPVFIHIGAVVYWSSHTTSKRESVMTTKIKASTNELVAIKSALALMLYKLHNPYDAQSILDCLRESGFPEAIALADEIAKFAPAPPPRL
ncbi:hypothetical protein BAE97_09875 [Salmonella enterica subsp. enterica serovar Sundsvall]|nr:hypothetical protein [Salmonella enterica]EAS2321457.1 hypothetical protein [Salmonella enterica]EBV7011337.1 hypothetical protein [Salmonella enterica subsp. enterica serovar Pomona]ECS5235105.1 hypothetical protein [Salmonella enterica subsp. enterica serovar Sundsvall]ECU7750104.1 hypothetical protein [Salmonella enterica]